MCPCRAEDAVQEACRCSSLARAVNQLGAFSNLAFLTVLR